MIGAGGVATVAAYKIVQNADVFTEFMIASHHQEKCDRQAGYDGIKNRTDDNRSYRNSDCA